MHPVIDANAALIDQEKAAGKDREPCQDGSHSLEPAPEAHGSGDVCCPACLCLMPCIFFFCNAAFFLRNEGIAFMLSRCSMSAFLHGTLIAALSCQVLPFDDALPCAVIMLLRHLRCLAGQPVQDIPVTELLRCACAGI